MDPRRGVDTHARIISEPTEVRGIEERRHPKLLERARMDRMIGDAYAGAFKFAQAGYLDKDPRETDENFVERKKRAVPWLHVRELADILGGFMYATDPVRDIPDNVTFINEKFSKMKTLEEFMQDLAIRSLIQTVGLLIDSPVFDSDETRTVADEQDQDLNPFAIVYFPWQVRDFQHDEDGSLEWVFLDNSSSRSKGVEDPRKVEHKFTLWTREFWQDYIFKKMKNTANGVEKTVVEVGPENPHPVGEVPFRFVTWRDNDEDSLGDGGVFDDITLLDQKIFNTLSYLDEMIAAGTFKALAFPIDSDEDIPEEVIEDGISNLTVIPFPGKFPTPSFIGATMSEITNYFVAIDRYLREIFEKVGLDIDHEKKFMQSGTAKSMEFQKAEALLRQGAIVMEKVEIWAMKIMGRWRRQEAAAKVSYSKKFKSEDVDIQLARLYEVRAQDIEALMLPTIIEIVRRVFPDMEPKEMKALVNQIKKSIMDAKKAEVEAVERMKKVREDLADRPDSGQEDESPGDRQGDDNVQEEGQDESESNQ